MTFPVSIICPTFNHAQFIESCIASVQAQTFEDWELLVMDDGSSDGTGERVMAFSDRRIRYFHQEHAGLAGLLDTYNRALAAGTGELVAVVEGDDFWPPDKLARLMVPMHDPDVVLAYGVTQRTDAAGVPLEITIPTPETRAKVDPQALTNEPVGSAVAGMLLTDSLWTCSVSSLLRRTSLERIGGFRSIAGGCLVDRPTFFELGLHGRFAFVDRVMGYWRRHGANSTGNLKTWNEIASGLGDFMAEFAQGNRRALGLTAEQVAATVTRARRSTRTAELALGRSLLVDRHWREAALSFRRALADVDGLRTHTAVAALGVAASYLHADLEPLFRWTSRQVLRS